MLLCTIYFSNILKGKNEEIELIVQYSFNVKKNALFFKRGKKLSLKHIFMKKTNQIFALKQHKNVLQRSFNIQKSIFE